MKSEEPQNRACTRQYALSLSILKGSLITLVTATSNSLLHIMGTQISLWRLCVKKVSTGRNIAVSEPWTIRKASAYAGYERVLHGD
uniref:Uncharacterized protein n=1 Tax=Parascaris univalens TaxID=6257 RepID=A0A915CEJ2_PARUN